MASLPSVFQAGSAQEKFARVDEWGNLEDVNLSVGSQAPQSLDTAYTTGAAAVASQQGPLSVLDVNAGGAGAVNLATGAALDAAYPSLEIGQAWIFFVQNNLGAAAAATLTASAGHTIDADTTVAIADQATATVRVLKTGVATYVSRVVSVGTH